MTSRTRPMADDIVAAVRLGSRAVPRLARRFIDEIGDPVGALPEVASGGFVWFHELDDYEDFDDLTVLEGRVSSRRLDALEAGAAPSPTERLICARRKLRDYFAEPVEGAVEAPLGN